MLMAPVLMLTGCSKDKTIRQICRIQSIVYNSSDTSSIVYNDQMRVFKFGNLSGNHYTFNYSGLTATMQFGSETIDLFLNADGNLVSFEDETGSGPSTLYYSFNFNYNGDKQLVLSVQEVADNVLGLNNSTYKDSLVYSNGNLVEKYTFFKGPLSSTFSLEERIEIDYSSESNRLGHYYQTADEESISILSGWQHIYHLLGKPSRHLPTASRVYNAGGSLIRQHQYTFMINEDGYPVEVNIVTTGVGTQNRKFEYLCE